MDFETCFTNTHNVNKSHFSQRERNGVNARGPTVVYKQITVKIVLLHLRQNWQGEGNFYSKHCTFEINFVSFQKIVIDKNYHISFSTWLLTKFRNYINKSTWYSIRQSQFLSSIVLSQNFVFISFWFFHRFFQV